MYRAGNFILGQGQTTELQGQGHEFQGHSFCDFFERSITKPYSSTSFNRFSFHFILSNKRTIWGQSLTQLANYCVICSIF